MATVALVWESGCGWGHVVPLRQLAGELVARGHTVVHVSRELERSHALFADLDVELVQAPVLVHEIPGFVREPGTQAHVLHNDGFGDRHALGGLGEAWRALFRRLDPDLIVLDAGSVSLLAARTVRAARVTFGTGFFHPPEPFPDLRPDLGRSAEELAADERRVLVAANRQLDAWGDEPIGKLSDLWLDVDDALVTTVPELDPFGPRDIGYVGVLAGEATGAREPIAPGSCRVFAYLKPFPALPSLLRTMSDAGRPTLVVGDLVPRELQESVRSEHLTFAQGLVDIEQAAVACDFAVLNATHGATAALLGAGKPLLALPLNGEQRLTARCVERMGAGLVARPDDPDGVANGYWRVATESGLAGAARAFAERNRGRSGAESARRAADRVDAVLRR